MFLFVSFVYFSALDASFRFYCSTSLFSALLEFLFSAAGNFIFCYGNFHSVQRGIFSHAAMIIFACCAECLSMPQDDLFFRIDSPKKPRKGHLKALCVVITRTKIRKNAETWKFYFRKNVKFTFFGITFATLWFR